MARGGKVNRADQAAVLEVDEMQLLFAELDDPYRAIAQICYFTAGRISEVLSLKAENVKNGYVVFEGSKTKTGETRRVVISKPLQQVLDRLAVRSGYLFPSGGKSGHLTARSVEYRVKDAAELLDFEGVSLHSFRRSRLTHLHEQGWGLHELKRVSGHKSLQQLQQYLGVDQAAVDEKLRLADSGFDVA